MAWNTTPKGKTARGSALFATPSGSGNIGPESNTLRVTLPPLPAQAAQPCPLPSPLPDGQIPTLISALMDAWEGLAACEVKRAGAVAGYDAARKMNP